MADAPRKSSMAGADGPTPRAMRCVLLAARGGREPGALIGSFRARGVEVSIEFEPLLALAEVGRCIVEHRQRAGRDATMCRQVGETAVQPSPSVILVIVEPSDFTDLDELVSCIARSMPLVTIAAYQEGASPSLQLLKQRPTEKASATRAVGGSRMASMSRSPRLVLRLADRLDPRGEPASAAAQWLGGPIDDAGVAGAEPPEVGESLISEAELAMLLGDDCESGTHERDEERGT